MPTPDRSSKLTAFIGFYAEEFSTQQQSNQDKHCYDSELELQANDPSDFTIIEKALTIAFSWLKVPTGAFTLKKTQLRRTLC